MSEPSNSEATGEIVTGPTGTQEFRGALPSMDPDAPASAPVSVPEKFRNADGSVNIEALVKSYSELEKRFHQPAPEADAEEAPAQPEAEPEENPAEPEKAPEEVPEEKPEAQPEGELANVIDVARQYFAEHGDLPAEARKDLHRMGIDDAVIDLQISGAKAYTATLQAEATKAAGVQDYAEVEKAIAWAATNWSEKKIAAFNSQVNDVETVGDAVATLYRAYAATQPAEEGKLLNVSPAVSRADTFSSRSEFQAAMAKAEAQATQAERLIARRAVIAKMDRSLKAGVL